MRRFLASAFVLLAAAAPAAAEIYRCVGANGEVRYVSSAAQCPNALPVAPKESAVQRVGKSSAPLATARPGATSSSARRAASAAAANDAAQEIAWRNKKAEAERKVQVLEAQEKRLDAAMHWCNKGHEVVRKDPRTGIREEVPCERIQDDHERAEAELETARAYLGSGLEEECRRSGCMPGWIR